MKKYTFLVMTALLLGCLFHQDMILRHFFSVDEKVAAPMQSSRARLGDHYYYYITSKKALGRLTEFASGNNSKNGSFFYKNSGLEDIYPGALITSGVIDKFVESVFPVSWNKQVLLSFILQTSLLFASVILLYQSLLKSKPISWVSLFIFSFFWALLSRGFIYGVYFGDIKYPFVTSPFYYPDILRLVNPQITWAFTLFYMSLLGLWFERRNKGCYVGLILLSLAFGTFSTPLTVTVGIGLGMCWVYWIILKRTVDIHLMGIGLALLLSFLYAQHQINLFHLTEKGMEIQTGGWRGLSFRPYFLVLLIFIPLIRRYLPNQSSAPLTWIFIASLTIACFCDSFYLGNRIWLRGSAVLAYFLVLFGIFEYIRSFVSRVKMRHNLSKYQWISWLVAGSISVFYLQETSFTGWYGYVEKDKAKVIEWLRSNAGRSDIVVSADLEDTYYIPLYTKSVPFVQLYDYSTLNSSERLTHYFQTLDLFGVKPKYLELIMDFDRIQYSQTLNKLYLRQEDLIEYQKYQIFGFFAEILYFPYNKSVTDIFSSTNENLAFDSAIQKVADSSRYVDIPKGSFVIYKKRVGLVKPQGFTSVYENSQYEIFVID